MEPARVKKGSCLMGSLPACVLADILLLGGALRELGVPGSSYGKNAKLSRPTGG